LKAAFILFPLACSAASFHWNFPGGSLDRIEQLSADHYRVFVRGQTDQDHRNRQASWYYFRVDGARERTLTIDIAGLPGEYNYQPNRGAINGSTPPHISYDQSEWAPVSEVEYDAGEPRLTLRIHPSRARFWIAHTPPYTLSELERLRRAVRRNSESREQIIGRSVQGRPILLWTIQDPGASKVVWLMFRQHAWESGSSWTGDGAVRTLLAEPGLRARIVWKVLPLADPDGVEAGGVRFNRNGYDLNRNWDLEDSPQMPEIAAQRKAIRQSTPIQLFLTLHNTETSEYLQGPQSRLAARLFTKLKATTTFDPTRDFVVVQPNQERGRSDAVQALCAAGVPAFLMEQRISFNARLGRQPSVSERTRFGRELVQAIKAVLE
jgi:hypothetical protein